MGPCRTAPRPRHLHRKGFTGVIGMEHGNSRPGREGERAVIDAYVEADDF